MSKPSSDRALLELVLTDRRVPFVLAGVYLLFGVVLVVTDYTLNDEGLFTFMSAAQTRVAFSAFVFFQKSKPVLSVLYLLPVAAGLTTFLLVHVIVAAAAVPLAASVARALGFSAPNFPAMVIACSPLYFFGGPAGLANTDGVAGVLLFLYLLVVRRQRVLAGCVLGLLPWVRHELALFCAAATLFPLFSERNPRVLLGALVFPAVYWLFGWQYHQDVLWLLHYPPTTLEPPGITAHNPAMPLFYRTASLTNALPFVLAVSPMVPLMFAAGRRGVSAVEWTLLGYSAAWLGFSFVLPSFEIANFGFVPRYMLPILPATALLSGRAVSRWWNGELPGLPWMVLTVIVLVALWLSHALPLSPAAAGAVIVLGLAGAIAIRSRSSAVVAATVALTLAGPAMGLPTQIPRKDLAGYLPATEHWLRQHRQEITGPIYTNSLLLGPFLQRHAPDLHFDVRFLLAVDQMADALAMVNPHNGQMAEGKRALFEARYPGMECLWTGDLTPESVPHNALFIFRPGDERIKLTLPRETWGPHLRQIADASGQIFQFVP